MIKTGDDFYGFRVVRSEDHPLSHIFVFEKRGKFIQLEMPTNEYISLILDEYERQPIMDAMVKYLYQEYGAAPGSLEGAWSGF